MLVISQKKLPRIGCTAVNWLMKEGAQDRFRCGDLVGENSEKPQMGNFEQSRDEAANTPHSKPRKKKEEEKRRVHSLELEPASQSRIYGPLSFSFTSLHLP